MSNLNEKEEEEKKKMKNSAQYIYDGEDLGHPYIQSTTVLCDRLDAEAKCLHNIEARGAVECGVPSAARALPTCPEGFNFM